MNKADMISTVATKFGLTRANADEYITFILDTMSEKAVEDGLACYGPHRFTKVERSARKGRNPRTGEAIDIPAAVSVKYKKSKKAA